MANRYNNLPGIGLPSNTPSSICSPTLLHKDKPTSIPQSSNTPAHPHSNVIMNAKSPILNKSKVIQAFCETHLSL